MFNKYGIFNSKKKIFVNKLRTTSLEEIETRLYKIRLSEPFYSIYF